MNIGEFFVTLGVKGSEKTLSALSGVSDGLGSIKSMSLEAKAAILGAVYAFERMMTSSSKTGTELQNFNALTGISTQDLQKWQYAGRQVGLTNEEIAGSFKSVQSVMGGLQMGKMPEGMAYLTNQLAKHGVQFDPAKALKDTQYAMQKFQQFALTETNVSLRNWALKSMGLSEGMIAGMTRNAFNPTAFAKAPAYSEKEIASLGQANAAWTNLGTKIEMAFGHFNAKHGVQLVNDLTKITTQVIKLVEQFLRLTEVLHLFQGIGKVVEATTKVLESANWLLGGQGKGKSLKELQGHYEKNIPKLPESHPFMDFIKSHLSPPETHSSVTRMQPAASPITPGTIAPPITKNVSPNSTQNNNVNQTFHFQNPGSDHKQIGDSAGKAIKNAFFQIPQFGGW